MDAITLLAVLGLGSYAIACAVWPYRRCGRCAGTGKRRSPSGKAWRDCPRCGGDGVQVRAGRYLAELFRFGPRRGR